MLVLKNSSDPRQITGLNLLRMGFLVLLMDKCGSTCPLLNISLQISRSDETWNSYTLTRGDPKNEQITCGSS